MTRKHDRSQISQSYLSGLSFKEISELYKCSMGLISIALKENNVEVRPRKSGPDHPQYKGGIYKDHDNYIIVGNSKERLHRVIMEERLQRKLYSWEHVHHINGIKDDNVITNLIIMPTREHTRFHTFLRNCTFDTNRDNLEKYCKKENDYTYRFTKENLIRLGIPNTIKLKPKKKCKIAGCDNNRYSKGVCNKHYQRIRAKERGHWLSGGGRKAKYNVS